MQTDIRHLKHRPSTLWTIARLGTRLSIVLTAVTFAGGARAAKVKSVKQSRALLVLEKDESLSVGDVLTIFDTKGEKQATLLITTTKGRRAVAKIQSGEANPRDVAVLEARADQARSPRAETPASSPSPSPTPAVEANPAPSPSPGPSPTPAGAATDKKPSLVREWSLSAGGSMDSQLVKLTSSAQVSLTGISFFGRVSRTGVFPEIAAGPISHMAWEAGAGLEQLKTTGTIPSGACRNSTDCLFNIVAVSPFGRIGYVLFKPIGFQLRLGVDLVIPISVSSNVIDYQPFRPLSLLTAGVFFQFKRGGKYHFPVALDYATYIGNNDVTLTRTMFSAGVSW